MKALHIVGRRNQGKTTLMEQLVATLTARGLQVGTIKHTSHEHELDTSGKDSHRHRQAGGAPAAIIAPHLVAAYLPRLSLGDPYDAIAPLFDGCDLVLIEGDLERPGLKLEVWRTDLDGEPPLAVDHQEILAVITDDDLPPAGDPPLIRLPRRDLEQVADFVIEQL